MRTRIGVLLTVVMCAGILPGCAFISRATETETGTPANGDSNGPVLSADAHWLAFVSQADNLVSGDTNGSDDAFVRDNWTKAVTRVSVTSGGAQHAGGFIGRLAISDNGRIVVFESTASDLVPGDANGAFDIFWHDRDSDQDGIYDEPGAIATMLVSANVTGSAGNGDSLEPSVNSTGSVVAYSSLASDLLAAPDHDTNATFDVFATSFDLAGGQRTGTRIVSRAPGLPTVEANDGSLEPSVDGSGNVIAFTTTSDNLLTGDTNGTSDVVVNDGSQIFRGTGFVQANGINVRPALSRDGASVAYVSNATNLVSGDVDADFEVFVTDFAQTGTTESASGDYWNAPSHPHGADDRSTPAISADGSRVAFISLDPELVPGDTNSFYDAFVHDFVSGLTQRVSTDAALKQLQQGGDQVALSSDGRFVASLTRLLRPGGADIFVRTTFVPVIDSVRAIDPVTQAELPPVLHPGANQLVVNGALFGPDVAVGLGNGLTVSVLRITAGHIVVAVIVPPNTAAGVRDIAVSNRGNQGALGGGTFQICHACVTVATN